MRTACTTRPSRLAPVWGRRTQIRARASRRYFLLNARELLNRVYFLWRNLRRHTGWRAGRQSRINFFCLGGCIGCWCNRSTDRPRRRCLGVIGLGLGARSLCARCRLSNNSANRYARCVLCNGVRCVRNPGIGSVTAMAAVARGMTDAVRAPAAVAAMSSTVVAATVATSTCKQLRRERQANRHHQQCFFHFFVSSLPAHVVVRLS